MKNLTTLIYSIIFLFIAFQTTAESDSKKDHFLIIVEGLGCPFCAYGLEKKFKEINGIDDIKIEIETGKFTFSFPEEKKISLKTVEQQVKAAGYTPVETEIKRANGKVEKNKK